MTGTPIAAGHNTKTTANITQIRLSILRPTLDLYTEDILHDKFTNIKKKIGPKKIFWALKTRANYWVLAPFLSESKNNAPKTAQNP
jgi:hypothetical protein